MLSHHWWLINHGINVFNFEMHLHYVQFFLRCNDAIHNTYSRQITSPASITLASGSGITFNTEVNQKFNSLSVAVAFCFFLFLAKDRHATHWCKKKSTEFIMFIEVTVTNLSAICLFLSSFFYFSLFFRGFFRHMQTPFSFYILQSSNVYFYRFIINNSFTSHIFGIIDHFIVESQYENCKRYTVLFIILLVALDYFA